MKGGVEGDGMEEKKGAVMKEKAGFWQKAGAMVKDRFAKKAVTEEKVGEKTGVEVAKTTVMKGKTGVGGKTKIG